MTKRPEPHPALTAPADDLRRRAIRGSVAISAAQGVKLLIQFLSVIILARLLSPMDFGYFAMIMPVAAFVMMLQDLGLSQAVQTSADLDQEQASALFWVNVALAALLALLFALSAPLVAAFYDSSLLIAPTFALAAAIFASGLAAQHLALLTRSMRFGPLAAIDVAGAVAGFGVAVLIGILAPSLWALVWSVIATMAVNLIGGWWMARWRPGRPAPYRQIRRLLRLGGGLSVFSLTNFLARNLDNVLIGRFTGAVQLGLYDRAYKLLLFPLQQINNPIGRVMVPVLSRLAQEPHRYRDAYRRSVQSLLTVTLPGVAFLLMFADDVIISLMGARWAPAVGIFTWLAIAALHQPLSATFGWLFISQQRGGDFARWGVVNALSCIASFVIGLPWGAIGVAAAYALSDVLLRLPALIWWVGRRGPVGVRDLGRIAAPFAAALPVALGTLYLLHDALDATPFTRIVAGLAVAYTSFWLILATFRDGRMLFREGFTLMRNRFGWVAAAAAA